MFDVVMFCDAIVISDIRKILGNVALWRVRRDKHINDYGDKWLSVLTVKYIGRLHKAQWSTVVVIDT